jgi:hypothetical protein
MLDLFHCFQLIFDPHLQDFLNSILQLFIQIQSLFLNNYAKYFIYMLFLYEDMASPFLKKLLMILELIIVLKRLNTAKK